VIALFQGIFKKLKLDLYLFPYKVIPNRTGQNRNLGGIIECVKDKPISRDEIGKTQFCSLYQYFLNNFGGTEDSEEF